MERKIIADSQITQSSVYNANTHQGFQARLNNNKCWCSATAQQSNQWVRVDLKHPMSITGIATQGDPNWPPNFVTKFKLRYSVDGSDYLYKIVNLVDGQVSTPIFFTFFTLFYIFQALKQQLFASALF